MARILIVEDDPTVRALLRDILGEAGHQIQEADDGEEGIKRYHPALVDLVVTDILMPKKGGLNLIRDIRDRAPTAPIIAMSGGGKDGKLNFLGTAQTYDRVLALRKPFQHTELLALVEKALGHQ